MKKENVVYMYTVFGLHAYLGKGATDKRAYDLKGHKHCIPAEVPHNLIDVHIIADGLTRTEAAYVEAEMIRGTGLTGVWNNIQGLTPDKARLLANEILNREDDGRPTAKKKYMTVPSELTKKMLNYVTINNEEKILIPSDKNANLHKGIRELEINKTNQIDVVDADIGSRSLHGETKGKTLLIDGDFLETEFTQKYDTIVMNPPWTSYGKKFIAKAEKLLKNKGKLICIVGYNEFASKITKNIKPGSFLDLQQKGHFQRLENYSGGGHHGTRDDYFTMVGDWIWFIWQKGVKKGSTQIVNRYGEEFSYTLDGNEYYVPQLPNERDYFDYNDGIVQSMRHCKKVDKETKTVFNWTGKRGIEIEDCPAGVKWEGVTSTQFPLVDHKKLENWFNDIGPKRLNALYFNTQGGGTFRFPPVRKDLIGK